MQLILDIKICVEGIEGGDHVRCSSMEFADYIGMGRGWMYGKNYE